jgi:hypothetical protein
MINPELGYDFPFRSSNGPLVGGFIGGSDEIMDLVKKDFDANTPDPKAYQIERKTKINETIEILEKEVEFKNIDVRNMMESFEDIHLYFTCIMMLISKSLDEATCEEDLLGWHRFFMWLSIDATQKYFEFIGYWTAKMEEKKKQTQRTSKSTIAKQIKRKRVASVINQKYLEILRDNPSRQLLTNLSERKLTEIIKGQVESDPSFKQISKSISTQTIKNILRNRDKNKIPSYPWENKRG